MPSRRKLPAVFQLPPRKQDSKSAGFLYRQSAALRQIATTLDDRAAAIAREELEQSKARTILPKALCQIAEEVNCVADELEGAALEKCRDLDAFVELSQEIDNEDEVKRQTEAAIGRKPPKHAKVKSRKPAS